jgi:hypothetical protein
MTLIEPEAVHVHGTGSPRRRPLHAHDESRALRRLPPLRSAFWSGIRPGVSWHPDSLLPRIGLLALTLSSALRWGKLARAAEPDAISEQGMTAGSLVVVRIAGELGQEQLGALTKLLEADFRRRDLTLVLDTRHLDERSWIEQQRRDPRVTVACPNDDAIVSAPSPPAIVERGKLGDTLITEATCDKFMHPELLLSSCPVPAPGKPPAKRGSFLIGRVSWRGRLPARAAPSWARRQGLHSNRLRLQVRLRRRRRRGNRFAQ